MVDIRSVNPGEYNKLLAEALKELPEFKRPDWVVFVKSGVSKKRPILDEDFWHKRAASILRQIYIKNTIGVERLRSRYGGRQDRGVRPPRFVKGSGKIIRVILQQAETAGLIEKVKGKKSGRRLTSKGKEFIEKVGGKQ